MTRYLDYCSEMLSLTSKVAVLFAQGFPDPVVTEAVSDIERIAAGLSQKIWQKIMILETLPPDAAPPRPARGGCGNRSSAATGTPARRRQYDRMTHRPSRSRPTPCLRRR